MFIEDYMNDLNKNNSIQKLARESSTFNCFYEYWRDILFERVMKLFVWSGTEEVAPKEIEMRLMLTGHCGISPYKGELTAFFGSFFGVTKYLDEFTNYNVMCPIYSGTKTIGQDVVVISNNALRNPIFPLIHHYAILLAHCDVTLVDLMVNARDAGGVPIAQTEKQKQSITEYQSKIFNGQYGVVMDPALLGVEYAGTSKGTNQSILDIEQAKEKALKSFYSDIGVRSAFEKRSNTVESEVEADTSLLLLNLADMLEFRKKGAEEVNKLFNTNWSVDLADELKYGLENNTEERSMENDISESDG